MGEVFVARRFGAGQFEKDVALKLLLPHLVDDAEFVERFFDEARLAARMNHPNIVQIFDVGQAEGRPYLAMALIEGVSLGTLLKCLKQRRVSLPLPLARLIATGLLEALGYAHALTGSDGQPLGVVHRDVSPSNVMLSTAGAVLLTDFGIAKAAINLHFTQPGALRGKAAYVAPEQASGAKVSPRTDLFSAAVVLYEALTLVSPFKRTLDIETIDAVKKEMPIPADKLRPEVGPAMSNALLKALAKDPAQRFATARAFREAFVDGPVATAPELAEFIATHCAEEVQSVRAATATPARSAGTASLPSPGLIPHSTPGLPSMQTDPSSLPEPRPSRAPLAVGAVVLVACLAGAAWWLSSRPGPPQPVVEVAAPPVEPPLELDAGVAEVAALPPAPAPVEPEAVPADEPKRPDAHHPRPKAKPPEAARLENPPAIKVGYLTADAEPWARVLLDGRELDQTPLSRFPVPVGKHTLLFRAEDGREEKRPVVVEEGKVVTLRVDFKSP